MPPAPNFFNPTLEFWDVPSALLGGVVALALSTIHLPGIDFAMACAPPAFVALRRAVFPQLASKDGTTKPPPSIGRRIGAYACVVGGGFFVLVGGMAFYFAATDAKHPAIAWLLLIVFAFGGAIATRGFRVLL